jgi:hypothetical protein
VTDETGQPVSVSRTIHAGADRLFGILAGPGNHPVIDGSGMLTESTGGQITAVGDVFTMKMHNGEMGDYEIANHVVEFELNRRLGWEPELTAASREEDKDGIGQHPGHRWSFELTPLDPGSTVVIETYDCSRAPDWLRQATKGGALWTDAMTATLAKLDELSQSGS